MGSQANSSSSQTTIKGNPLLLLLSASSQLLLLKPMPSPRLRLMPTTAIMDTVLPTMDMDTAWPTTVTMAMPTLMPTDTTTARGPLMLRLSPLLMLTTVIIMDTDWPTTDTDAHHGYYGYPYAHHGYYYGKRSADAEPAADAYYGHHYGYAPYGYAHRGYYGYPYAHHGYYGYGYHH